MNEVSLEPLFMLILSTPILPGIFIDIKAIMSLIVFIVRHRVCLSREGFKFDTHGKDTIKKDAEET